MHDILPVLISSISAIIVAFIGAHSVKVERENKKRNVKLEAREKRREQESRLSMDMMYATMQLSIVSANALTNGHNNGNVEAAYKSAQEAKDKYDAFLKDVTSHSL